MQSPPLFYSKWHVTFSPPRNLLASTVVPFLSFSSIPLFLSFLSFSPLCLFLSSHANVFIRFSELVQHVRHNKILVENIPNTYDILDFVSMALISYAAIEQGNNKK
jgi:hypothetical protein